MILVDTSVWVAHLRANDETLGALLSAGQVLVHPFVIGEIALGHLKQRHAVLDSLSNLPRATVATDGEVLHFIEQHGLTGNRIGYVDAHLLASVRLTAGSTLWTHDKRLQRAAEQLHLAAR